ncbi:MAG: replication-relaxation family protein [Rhodovulum sp.]
MPHTDRLGRATFHHIEPVPDVRATERELRWLMHLERHGPQSSEFLYECTRNTHRCRDTALRALQKLRAGGYLTLPPQQRKTAKADFNPYIYDLTRKAREYLDALRIAEPTIRPTGHWWHGYAVACVTSAIDIAAARDGVRYIPAHEILVRRHATIAIPVGTKRLIPDQLFALDYGGNFRVFALEVDRGTEPQRSRASRKSLAASLGLYARTVESELYKTHYGLKATMLALWVFFDFRRQARFLDLAEGYSGAVRKSILTACVDPTLRPDAVVSDVFRAHWKRSGEAPVRICTA